MPLESRWRRLPLAQEAGLLGVVLVLVIALSVYGAMAGHPRHDNAFLNLDNLVNGVGEPMSVFGIMAVGMTLVIITGGIDISVGSIFALSAMMTAWSLQHLPVYAPAGQVLPLAMAIALGVGLACGLVNGLLIVLLRLHPFIVTLGTMSVFRGLVNVLPPQKTLPAGGADLPDALTRHLLQADFGAGLRPAPMLFMLVAVVFGWLFLRYMAPGRETYAIGGNEEAARYSGIRTGWTKVAVYAICGLLAGLAGLVSVGRFGTASTNTAQGYELSVVAAAVVGGASLTGGRGTALGALLGALVIALIENGFIILRLNQEYSTIIIGSAIIVAVAVDRLTESVRGRSAPV